MPRRNRSARRRRSYRPGKPSRPAPRNASSRVRNTDRMALDLVRRGLCSPAVMGPLSARWAYLLRHETGAAEGRGSLPRAGAQTTGLPRESVYIHGETFVTEPHRKDVA